MNATLRFALFLPLFVLSACDSPEKRIKAIAGLETRMEQQVLNPSASDTPDDVPADVINHYLAFVETYPAHEQAAEYLYKAAMVKADRKQDFEGCIQVLERIRRDYGTHRRAENALFLIGYTYAEHIKDLEKARTYYQAFLQQYPQSEMKTSVEFELAHLGTPVDELPIFKELTK